MNAPRTLATIALLCLLSQGAVADVWSWVDNNGVTHFVDTNRPIYTWQDDSGKVFFSDKPEVANAIRVHLIWQSSGTLAYVTKADSSTNADELYPGETEAERAERKQAEAYYCKNATEIYDAYVDAPRLFKTGEDGEPEYLSDEEAAQTIAATKARVDELCN